LKKHNGKLMQLQKSVIKEAKWKEVLNPLTWERDGRSAHCGGTKMWAFE
jgi:hypothetical protein